METVVVVVVGVYVEGMEASRGGWMDGWTEDDSAGRKREKEREMGGERLATHRAGR